MVREWCGTTFSVVDTGGYTVNSEDVFEEEIRKQVMIAIEEADVILFLVEVGTGITDFDEEIAGILRRSDKPVLLVVNKVDSADKRFDSYTSPRPTAAAPATCWTGSCPCCPTPKRRRKSTRECRV